MDRPPTWLPRIQSKRLPSTSHAWAVQHQAWNGGRMDRWLPAHRAADGAEGPYTMGYFKREDIPFHHALAEAFTICDAYHCSTLGPTRPNRFHWLTGTANADGRFDFANNWFPPEGLAWKTYPERLEEAGVSWKVYQATDKGSGFNVLRYFRQFMDSPPGSPLRSTRRCPCQPGRARWGTFVHCGRPARWPATTPSRWMA